MDKKHLSIGAGFAAVLLLLVAFIFPGATKPLENAANHALGALAGPDIPFPYLNWGGVNETRASQSLTATSSIVCAIQAPAATSTLLGFTVNMPTIGGLVAGQTFFLSTSTTAFASSTPFIGMAGLQAQGDYVFGLNLASSTNMAASATGQLVMVRDGGLSNNILQPNVYLTLRIATTTAGTFGSYPTGACKARFQPLP